jgi:hypothetical protein
MKAYIYLLPLMVLLACNRSADSEKTEQTEDLLNAAGPQSTVLTDTLCYLLTEGLKNQDTTIVQLAITGNTVAGRMAYKPYEKDSRKGTLSGIKEGKSIRLQWTYMQEGMMDSIAVALRLNGDGMEQQHPAFDKNTGKEYFPDTAAYNRYYNHIDCSTAAALIK